MERECAFCGAALTLSVKVLCPDCAASHDACAQCASELIPEEEGYQVAA